MDDVRAVMDAAGSESALLWSGSTSSGLSILFAATYPDRCTGLALIDPRIRGTRAPDYPWAPTPEEWRRQLAEVRAGWGERGYLERLAREWAPEVADDEAFRDWFVGHMRRSLSPGAALTGVPDRDGAGRQRRPRRGPRADAHLPRPPVPGPAYYAAERIRGAEVVELPPFQGVFTWVDDDVHEATMAATARFIARLASPASPERVLATILFTDIVGSTELARAARRHGVARAAGASPRHRPTRARAIRRPRSRHGRGRLLRRVRWARPRRPGRCRPPRPAAGNRHRGARRRPHRRVRGPRRQDRGHRGLDRRPHLVARRARRGARLEDGQGPRRRLRAPLPGPRRAPAQGNPGRLAPVRARPWLTRRGRLRRGAGLRPRRRRWCDRLGDRGAASSAS